MRKALVVLTFLLVFGAAGAGIFYSWNARAAIPWKTDFAAARQLSASTGRPLLTYLYTDWCTYCKQMEASTLRDPLITKQMAPSYVWVKLNAETDPEGKRLHDQWGVAGYPTIVILDAKGLEVDRMEGYFAAPKLKEIVEFFLASPTSFGNIRDAAAQAPESLPAQYALGEKLLERNNFPEAAKQFAMVIGHDPENRFAMTDASYYFSAFSLASAGQADLALKQIDALRGKFPRSRFVADASVLQGQVLYYGGKPQQALVVLEDYLAKYPKHASRPMVSQMLNEIRVESGLATATAGN